MPVIINKVTKQKTFVTEEQLQTIRRNRMTRKLFTVITVQEPEEVTRLRASKKNSVD